MAWKWFKKKQAYDEIAPDDLFLDAQNLPQFNTQQFEGIFEQPIKKRVLIVVGALMTLVLIGFAGRLLFLQAISGETYFAQSEDNRLYQVPIFGQRGVITDRNGELLAWNEQGEHGEDFSRRIYKVPGFAHVLGYVKYPKKDTSGLYWRTEFEGLTGVERLYENVLEGRAGKQLLEVDATGKTVSEGTAIIPRDGENVELSLDARIQVKLQEYIQAMTSQYGYEGGAGIIMDVRTGELIALTNYPEYDPTILSIGLPRETITHYFTDTRKPMINRAVTGLYTPGSIVKPFIALGALNEGLVTPETTIMSTGSIEVPNPYDPEKPTLFYDWKSGGHGATDIYHAIAESVNTYFYAIGGGYKSQKGMGVAGIEKYIRAFKITEPTGFILQQEPEGVIPTPDWKSRIFNGDAWRLGDTYNTVIGQFGFQVTPLQMVRAMSGIANSGFLVTPHLRKDHRSPWEAIPDIKDSYYQVIRDAMHQTVTDGTGSILNLPYVSVAVKTGTAQTAAKTKVNAWTLGFFPYENPQYAFVVLMERGPREDIVGASWAMRQLFDWMSVNTPEYFEIVPTP